MTCQFCRAECKKGFVKAADVFITRDTTLTWYPEDQRKKFIKKNWVSLALTGDAYYCENCRKAFAVFGER